MRSRWTRNPEFGYDVLRNIPVLASCAPAWTWRSSNITNGTGTPLGLRRDQIPLVARIIAVLNVYDVMTHPRAYAKQHNPRSRRSRRSRRVPAHSSTRPRCWTC